MVKQKTKKELEERINELVGIIEKSRVSAIVDEQKRNEFLRPFVEYVAEEIKEDVVEELKNSLDISFY